MREVTISKVAEEFVLRTLASVTPQAIVLSERTPRRIGKAAGKLGFNWYYETAAETYTSADWGVLSERDAAFTEVLELLSRLRRCITDGGWVIVTIDDVRDEDRWSSGPDRRHPVLEAYGFALAADLEAGSGILTTIVRKVARELDLR